MKVLIFSMTVGEGHNMIARSVKEQLEALGCVTKVEQVFGFNEKLQIKENKRFLWACKRIPHLYNIGWNISRTRNPHKDSKFHFRRLRLCQPYFLKCIEEFKPDAIFCTHHYASNVLSRLKKEGKLDKNILLTTICYDYSVHPLWEFSTGADYVITAFDGVEKALIDKGFKKEQLVPLGLPSKKEFSLPCDKNALRKKLNINGNWTVFSIAGGNGLGNTLKLVKNILKYNSDANIIVVNGKNKKMFDKIENYKNKTGAKNIINLGFVNNVYDYMKASDVIFCRGGGGTLCEAFSSGIPLVIREHMITNEKINKKTLTEGGYCLGIQKITEAGPMVKRLREDKELYSRIRSGSTKIARPNAGEDIAKFIVAKASERASSK